jgi:hypothetical protein
MSQVVTRLIFTDLVTLKVLINKHLTKCHKMSQEEFSKLLKKGGHPSPPLWPFSLYPLVPYCH